jgi:protein-S-isoprenylcysteine O-methyltransferase Ste14
MIFIPKITRRRQGIWGLAILVSSTLLAWITAQLNRGTLTWSELGWWTLGVFITTFIIAWGIACYAAWQAMGFGEEPEQAETLKQKLEFWVSYVAMVCVSCLTPNRD